MPERTPDDKNDASPLQTRPQSQPLQARKGRGAVSNMQGRYDVQLRTDFDDGWSSDDDDDASRIVPKTRIFDEQARTILTRNASPDIPFNVSLNPYRGCEHVMRHHKLFTFLHRQKEQHY